MNYIKYVNEIFKFWNIIKNAIILALGIIVIDYLNIPSQFIEKDLFLTMAILIVLILLAIIEFIKLKSYKFITAKTINVFDRNIFILLITMLFYDIYVISGFKMYKVIILSIFGGILFCLLLWRIIYICKILKKQNIVESNICDLKEFLDSNNTPNSSNKLVLFSENDVKYDLLDREIFVDYIASLINYCNPEKSFVFALNGAWGSGKSTILNLVKNTINPDEMIVIDDFDPWKYNNNETLFRGFYDSITKNKNFAFDYSLYKKLYNIYKVLILGNDNILNKISFDTHFMDNSYSVDELKNIISTHLKINNKKVVFIIDNIDRLNKEQILIIFKTISTLFDFNNFVYLLSFDEERISKIFENELKIDPNYLNKIINSNISLPKTNSSTISEIAVKVIEKMYDYYNIQVDVDERNRFITMFSQLSSKFSDIRELKRFFNYISAYIQSKDIQEQVNIGDFIIIQTIKYLNIDLYNTIYSTPIFFVSEDRNLLTAYRDEYYFPEKFNTVAEEFYKNLFSKEKNKEYESIMETLFPYVDNFVRKYEIRTTIPYVHDQALYNDSIVNKRIFNGRYFEHYFELTPNLYSTLLKDVNEFIKHFNNEEKIEKIDLYYKILIMSDKNNQRFKLEILNQSLEKIDKYKIIHLIDIIYNNMNNLSINSNGSTMLGESERCILIFSEILNIVDIKLAKDKIEKFINENNKLLDIDSLIYWLNPEKQYQRNLNQELYDFARNKFVEKLNIIIDSKVDVVSDGKYGNYSILIFKKYSIKIEKIKVYLSEILNNKNIFRFLRNFIAEWIGKGYSYEFNEKELNEFVLREDIDKIISLVDYELNIEQQRVLDIYNKKIHSDKSFTTPINYGRL